MLALTVVTAFLYFLRAIGETVLLVIAVVLALLGIVTLFTADGNAYLIRTGIAGLVFGFLLSPYGLPALAGWLIDLVEDITHTRRDFIFG
ncbi:MAG: CD1845 family protein [Clostridiales bacterium]|nr:CD1845 family protein [Clostridiales bacterium]